MQVPHCNLYKIQILSATTTAFTEWRQSSIAFSSIAVILILRSTVLRNSRLPLSVLGAVLMETSCSHRRLAPQESENCDARNSSLAPAADSSRQPYSYGCRCVETINYFFSSRKSDRCLPPMPAAQNIARLKLWEGEGLSVVKRHKHN